jgi:hypothetical protein
MLRPFSAISQIDLGASGKHQNADLPPGSLRGEKLARKRERQEKLAKDRR